MHLRFPKLAVEPGGAAMNDEGGVGILLFQLIGLAVQGEASAVADPAHIAAHQRAVKVACFLVGSEVVIAQLNVGLAALFVRHIQAHNPAAVIGDARFQPMRRF